MKCRKCNKEIDKWAKDSGGFCLDCYKEEYEKPMKTKKELRKKYIKKIKLSSKQKRELWGEKINR